MNLKNSKISDIKIRTISKREISGRNGRMGVVLSKREPLPLPLKKNNNKKQKKTGISRIGTGELKKQLHEAKGKKKLR